MNWPPPVLPDSDQGWDEYTDAVACGLLDPEFLTPARLPGRPNHFETSRRPSRRDPSAVLGGPAEQSSAPSRAPRCRVAGAEESSSDDCGVPWSRDAA